MMASMNNSNPVDTLDDCDDEAGLWPSAEDLMPLPELPAHFEEHCVLTFAEAGEEDFQTSCGEIVAAYLVACAWKRAPDPGSFWLADVPPALRVTTHGHDGELRTNFPERQQATTHNPDLAWLCSVETNPDNASCEICGSELFLVFRDTLGKARRVERLTVLTAILSLSELGHIPKLPSDIYRALELEYDHICHSEHVLLGLGRGESGHV